MFVGHLVGFVSGGIYIVLMVWAIVLFRKNVKSSLVQAVKLVTYAFFAECVALITHLVIQDWLTVSLNVVTIVFVLIVRYNLNARISRMPLSPSELAALDAKQEEQRILEEIMTELEFNRRNPS
jgi:hypothetical protein